MVILSFYLNRKYLLFLQYLRSLRDNTFEHLIIEIVYLSIFFYIHNSSGNRTGHIKKSKTSHFAAYTSMSYRMNE